jgi:hypothetical protein
MLNFCVNCGESIDTQWKFCGQCGTSLEPAPQVSNVAKTRAKKAPRANKSLSPSKENIKTILSPALELSLEEEARKRLLKVAEYFLIDDNGDRLYGLEGHNEEVEYYREILEVVCIDDHDEFKEMFERSVDLKINIDDFVAYYLYRRAKYVVSKSPGFWGSLLKEPDINDSIAFKEIVEMYEDDEKLFSAFTRKLKPLAKLYPIFMS